MGQLYTLTFYDRIDDYRQGFFIGVFASYEEACEAANRYLNEVPGFKEYPCEYEITPKEIVGTVDESNSVSLIWGWNLNENLDEVDIWESQFYAEHETALQDLCSAKKRYERQEWCIDRYKIGELHWEDGFARARGEGK